MAAAHVRVQAGDDDGLDAQLLQEDVQVGLEETAVTALGHHVILVAETQLRDDLGAGRALQGVVAPELQLAVDAGQVAVVAENHGHALLAGGFQQGGGSGDDGAAAIAAQGAGDEVVEHVNDQDGGMIEFVHIYTTI